MFYNIFHLRRLYFCVDNMTSYERVIHAENCPRDAEVHREIAETSL